MLELYQTEWCRGSQLVRQRLTELALDFVARQVPEDPGDRDELEARTGVRSVPVLLLEDGSALHGSERILDHLACLPEPVDAARHAERAMRSLAKRCADLRSAECGSTPTSRERDLLPVGAPTS